MNVLNKISNVVIYKLSDLMLFVTGLQPDKEQIATSHKNHPSD